MEKQKSKSDQKLKSFYTASDGAIQIIIDKNGKIKIDTFKHTRTY